MKTFVMVQLLFTLASLSSVRVDCGSAASKKRTSSCSRHKYADTREMLLSVVDLYTIHAVQFLLEKFYNQSVQSFVSSEEYQQYSKNFVQRYYSPFTIKNARFSVQVNSVIGRIGAETLGQLRLQLYGTVCDWLREQMKTTISVFCACELENEAGNPDEYLSVYLDKMKRLNFLIRKRLLLIGGATMCKQYEARFDKCVLQSLERDVKLLVIHLPEPIKVSAASPKGNQKIKSHVVAGQECEPASPTQPTSCGSDPPPNWMIVFCATVFVWGLILVFVRDCIQRNPRQRIPLLHLDPDEGPNQAVNTFVY